MKQVHRSSLPAVQRRAATCGAWSWPGRVAGRGGGGARAARRSPGRARRGRRAAAPSYATRPSRITTARSTSGASGPSSWATSTIVAPRVLEPAQRVGEGLLVGQVDAGGRLVEEEQLGLAGQRAGDQHPLLLAAGERGRRRRGPGRRGRPRRARRRSRRRSARDERAEQPAAGQPAGGDDLPDRGGYAGGGAGALRARSRPAASRSNVVERRAEQPRARPRSAAAARSGRAPAWTCRSRWRPSARRTRPARTVRSMPRRTGRPPIATAPSVEPDGCGVAHVGASVRLLAGRPGSARIRDR